VLARLLGALVALVLLVGCAGPTNYPNDIPSRHEQLVEQERVKERYKGDFYEPVTTIR
jgi:hypothetical protein